MTATRRLIVTLHALSRWRERRYDITDTTKRTDDEIRVEIGRAFMRARPVRLRKERERALKALRNGGTATYHHFDNVVLVVTDDAVVSVYEYERTRWEAAT